MDPKLCFTASVKGKAFLDFLWILVLVVWIPVQFAAWFSVFSPGELPQLDREGLLPALSVWAVPF